MIRAIIQMIRQLNLSPSGTIKRWDYEKGDEIQQREKTVIGKKGSTALSGSLHL